MCQLDLGLQTARKPCCKLVLSSVILFYLKVSQFIRLVPAPKLFANTLGNNKPQLRRTGLGLKRVLRAKSVSFSNAGQRKTQKGGIEPRDTSGVQISENKRERQRERERKPGKKDRERVERRSERDEEGIRSAEGRAEVKDESEE